MREREEELPEGLGDESVDQMLVLAERLRKQNGGILDESAMQAVAEATGAPIEYVRLAEKLRVEKEKRNLIATVRAQFLTLEPETRRLVAAGVAGTSAAFLSVLDDKLRQFTQVMNDSAYGIFSMIGILAFVAGLYSTAIARDTRTAALSGAILCGGMLVMRSIFAAILFVPMRVSPFLLVPISILGAAGGVILMRQFEQHRRKLGFRDPVEERQELLAQLHNLRERLHDGAQTLTFLSIDVVGSTRMKQNADPLAVEFTFNEYHSFVERITKQYGGRVHSTAGDGVICAFDHSQQAFGAARNLQSGLIELNAHRNKLSTSIALRCGIHTGTVVAPDASDVTTLNFTTVIDIAAHLQKVTPPGGIGVSAPAAEGLIGGISAVGTHRTEVEGVEAAVWIPKAIGEPGIASPPPVPRNA